MCSVVGCVPGRRSVKQFKLPDDPERRQEWVQFLFEVNGQQLKGSNWTDIDICGEHFTEDCFVNPIPATGTMQLKCSAVPSVCDNPEPDQPLDNPQPVMLLPGIAVQALIVKVEPEKSLWSSECVSQETASDDEPSSKSSSEIVPLSDEESHLLEEGEEGDKGEGESGGEWSPTEDILLAEDAEELRGDQSQDEEEGGLDSRSGLKINKLCTECGSFYTRRPHTCQHKMKHFSCSICGTRCVSEISLKNHCKIHHETYEHPCKYCYATFKTKGDKLRHEQTHRGSENPYKSPDCPKMFASHKERDAHLSQHRTPEAVQCGVCGIEFGDLHHLRRHSVVHTGLKPYECIVCQRGFNQLSNLKSHMRVHTGEKPFQCQRCYKCFNHNVSLKSHVQRYHTERDGLDQIKDKRQKLDNNSGVAEDSGNMNGLDSECDNVEEEQNTEEAVQIKSPGTSKNTSGKRRTGRPRGWPKRDAAGDLVLAELKTASTTKLQIQSQKSQRKLFPALWKVRDSEEEQRGTTSLTQQFVT